MTNAEKILIAEANVASREKIDPGDDLSDNDEPKPDMELCLKQVCKRLNYYYSVLVIVPGS